MKKRFINVLSKILLYLVSGPSRKLTYVAGAELKKGETPSHIKLETWDYRHNGGRAIELTVYYKDLATDSFVKIPCDDFEDAVAKYRILEPLLGKKVL